MVRTVPRNGTNSVCNGLTSSAGEGFRIQNLPDEEPRTNRLGRRTARGSGSPPARGASRSPAEPPKLEPGRSNRLRTSISVFGAEADDDGRRRGRTDRETSTMQEPGGRRGGARRGGRDDDARTTLGERDRLPWWWCRAADARHVTSRHVTS